MTRSGRAQPVLARRRRQLRLRYTALAAVIAVPAMAAPGDWRVTEADPAPSAAPMGFEKPGESFPGSAFYYLADEPYVPLRAEAQIRSDGDEPALPFLNEAVGGPGETARPFFARGSGTDMARAQQCLSMAIYYEAASESDAGQRAVAQVVLNRVAHPTYPDTVCGVVFQGSERTTGCQFTFTCDGSLARRPAHMWWERASRVARAALAGAVYAPVGLATHYHTVQVHPYWAPSLHPVATIGAHRFYRWPGAAGQAAAFRAAYFGGEPAALPNPRVASRVVPVALVETPGDWSMSVAAPAVSRPGSGPAADSVTAFTNGKLPTSGSVLPAYERSGQWLDRRGASAIR
jgi:hypothetical protein